MILGHIMLDSFLISTNGQVRGFLISDGKYRHYSEDYKWKELNDSSIIVSKVNNSGDKIRIPSKIPIDESLIGFFGLYSGDGAKGSEKSNNPGKVKISISFSQREPNLVKFAHYNFQQIFGDSIRFNFAIGEDSAWFMDGEGLELLMEYYGGSIPPTKELAEIKPVLSDKDIQYLGEVRNVPGTNEEHLAFYYQHHDAMISILAARKTKEVRNSGILLRTNDKISASIRRPFKKGSRVFGNSSRSDELHVGGLNGFGELFIKILHEIEASISENQKISPQGLIEWNITPDELGEKIDIKTFFSSNPFGTINGNRPSIIEEGAILKGKWPYSKEIILFKSLRINPLWCYTSGLYLAEGSTKKKLLFNMYKEKVSGFNFGFTSSEGTSIKLMLEAQKKLFREVDCVHTWKVKVGSQYFSELVMIGIKNGVPMLRGGPKGQGKLLTMEISLSIKNWALQLVPALFPFSDKYSHVEPTGAGVARIDYAASSALCRWYFPLVIYALFSNLIQTPFEDFIHE